MSLLVVSQLLVSLDQSQPGDSSAGPCPRAVQRQDTYIESAGSGHNAKRAEGSAIHAQILLGAYPVAPHRDLIVPHNASPRAPENELGVVAGISETSDAGRGGGSGCPRCGISEHKRRRQVRRGSYGSSVRVGIAGPQCTRSYQGREQGERATAGGSEAVRLHATRTRRPKRANSGVLVVRRGSSAIALRSGPGVESDDNPSAVRFVSVAGLREADRRP
jgi:hypothetical protein